MLRADDIIVVIGRRRAGKTTLVKKLLIPQYVRSGIGVVIDDHVGEYKLPNFLITTNVKAVLYNKHVVLLDREASDEWFADFMNMLKKRYKRTRWRTVVVVDEAYNHFERRKLPQPQAQLLRLGRHYGLGVVLITHRLYDLSPLVYKIANKIIIFRTTEPRELDFIRKYVGYGAEEYVRKLLQYEYIVVDVDEGKVYGKYRLFSKKRR